MCPCLSWRQVRSEAFPCNLDMDEWLRYSRSQPTPPCLDGQRPNQGCPSSLRKNEHSMGAHPPTSCTNVAKKKFSQFYRTTLVFLLAISTFGTNKRVTVPLGVSAALALQNGQTSTAKRHMARKIPRISATMPARGCAEVGNTTTNRAATPRVPITVAILRMSTFARIRMCRSAFNF